MFEEKGIKNPETAKVYVSCQRAFFACTVDVGLRLLGNNNTAIYDGSYLEYSTKEKGE